MINLSDLALSSPQFSLFEKFRALRDADLYLAENVADFRAERDHLPFPWYKRGSFILEEHAWIRLYNVRLEHIENHQFLMEDASGLAVVTWPTGTLSFLTFRSYDEVVAEQGLEDGEMIYRILLIHQPRLKGTWIVEVERKPSSGNKKEEEPLTLADRVKEILGGKILVPQLT